MPLQRSPSAAEARAFQVKLIYIHRTKVAHVQQVPHDACPTSTSWRTRTGSQLLHTPAKPLFTEHGTRWHESLGWDSLTGNILLISPHLFILKHTVVWAVVDVQDILKLQFHDFHNWPLLSGLVPSQGRTLTLCSSCSVHPVSMLEKIENNGIPGRNCEEKTNSLEPSIYNKALTHLGHQLPRENPVSQE